MTYRDDQASINLAYGRPWEQVRSRLGLRAVLRTASTGGADVGCSNSHQNLSWIAGTSQISVDPLGSIIEHCEPPGVNQMLRPFVVDILPRKGSALHENHSLSRANGHTPDLNSMVQITCKMAWEQAGFWLQCFRLPSRTLCLASWRLPPTSPRCVRGPL